VERHGSGMFEIPVEVENRGIRLKIYYSNILMRR
jgi:hypothetical protein